jgi:hypothetical protein
MKYWVAATILIASCLTHFAWALDQVTNLTVTPGSTQVTLQWNAVPGAVGYVVLRNGAQIATVITTTYIDTGLTVNKTYNYSVGILQMTGGQLAFATVTTSAPAGCPGAAFDLSVTTGCDLPSYLRGTFG